jgi:hypothetical protein
MWHHVDLVWTELLEESIASIFRVEKSRVRNQHEQVASRLSHQSKTPSYTYKNSGREWEGSTWEINREERSWVCRDQVGSPGEQVAESRPEQVAERYGGGEKARATEQAFTQ